MEEEPVSTDPVSTGLIIEGGGLLTARSGQVSVPADGISWEVSSWSFLLVPH